MKALLKKLLIRSVNNKVLWPVIEPVAKLGFFAFHNKRTPNITNSENPAFAGIFEKKVVLNGPFKGMKYPSLSAVGSSFYPKLLGCYERELHHIIERFKENSYTEIIDIGCAEGYYAIGFAITNQQSTIYAYDTEEAARVLCNEMAHINGVAERVVIRETCTADELANFKFGNRSLIICDCEGYEQHLFSARNINNLKNCDLLIETHDFLDIHISENLVDLFNKTHDINIIKSIDDIEKAKTYSYKDTESLSLDKKFEIYREYRPAIMDWLICTPKATP